MCSNEALAFFKVHWLVWETHGVEPKYPFLWNLDKAYFNHALITEGDPTFTFSVDAHEI